MTTMIRGMARWLGHRSRECGVHFDRLRQPADVPRVVFSVDGPNDGMASVLRGYVMAEQLRRLGWRAFRTAGAEGTWELTNIEGTVPKELDGTLYRTAPGLSENHGIVLQHLFDGDAFVSGYTIRDGKVTLRANFVQTPEREEEQAVGRMLYREYGTEAPLDPPDTTYVRKSMGKNQPNVNIIPWDGRLLGLSEGGHPTAINPKTMQFEK